MENIAFILECDIDREYFQKYTHLAVDRVRSENRFGVVEVTELRSSDRVAYVYSEGGMNGVRTLPESHMPVFFDIVARDIRNLFLLGYCGSLNQNKQIGDLVVPTDFIDFTKNRERSFLEKIIPGELFFLPNGTAFCTYSFEATSRMC